MVAVSRQRKSMYTFATLRQVERFAVATPRVKHFASRGFEFFLLPSTIHDRRNAMLRERKPLERGVAFPYRVQLPYYVVETIDSIDRFIPKS